MTHLLKDIILEASFKSATLSGIAKKSIATYNKVTVRPISRSNFAHLEMTYHYENAVVHEQYKWQVGIGVIEKLLSGYFKQAFIKTSDAEYHILSNKKGRIRVLKM